MLLVVVGRSWARCCCGIVRVSLMLGIRDIVAVLRPESQLLIMCLLHYVESCIWGARRRRSGGGSGVGCAPMPVGSHLYFHAVGDGNHASVPSLAR
jgi:hypothetical protein